MDVKANVYDKSHQNLTKRVRLKTYFAKENPLSTITYDAIWYDVLLFNGFIQYGEMDIWKIRKSDYVIWITNIMQDIISSHKIPIIEKRMKGCFDSNAYYYLICIFKYFFHFVKSNNAFYYDYSWTKWWKRI